MKPFRYTLASLMKEFFLREINFPLHMLIKFEGKYHFPLKPIRDNLVSFMKDYFLREILGKIYLV